MKYELCGYLEEVVLGKGKSKWKGLEGFEEGQGGQCGWSRVSEGTVEVRSER